MPIQSCTIGTNTVLVKVTVSGGGSTTKSFVVNIGNFINPTTTCSITGIVTYLNDNSGNTVSQYTTTSLSGFTPATLSTASFTAGNTVVGASATTLTVSFVTLNNLPYNGYIMLTFPYWNSAAPSGSTYYHMISTSSPTCTGVTTLLVFLACTYSNDANK